MCRRNHAQFDNVPTRKGILQAEALACRFQDIPVDAIYSSDLYRALVTAQIVADRKGLKVIPRRLLREYTIGNWEGTAIGDSIRAYPEIYDVWYKTPWNNSIPGCDRFEAVAERAYKAIIDMVHENRGRTVLAITHVTTLGCAFTKLFNKPIDSYGSFPTGDNTAVSLIEFDDDDRPEVIFIGDSSHLPENLRRDYVGRTADTNFAYDVVSQDNIGVFLNLYEKWAEKSGIGFSREKALENLDECLSQGDRYCMIAMLKGRPCGFFMDRNDEKFPQDHALVDIQYMVEDITNPGMAAQIFGEALDRIRRQGKRYLVLKETEDGFTKFFLERFLFEPVPGVKGYQRMRITVPGLEGPVY